MLSIPGAEFLGDLRASRSSCWVKRASLSGVFFWAVWMNWSLFSLEALRSHCVKGGRLAGEHLFAKVSISSLAFWGALWWALLSVGTPLTALTFCQSFLPEE